MQDTLYHQADIHIERTENAVTVYDSEGDEIKTLDPQWTDEQIMQMLIFANVAYTKGIRTGQYRKQCEVAKVLGLPTQGTVDYMEQTINKRLDSLES